MFKILEHPTPLPSPVALVFAYGALDFNFTCESTLRPPVSISQLTLRLSSIAWMTPENLKTLRSEQSSANIPGVQDSKDHLVRSRPLSSLLDPFRRALTTSLVPTGSSISPRRRQRRRPSSSSQEILDSLHQFQTPLRPRFDLRTISLSSLSLRPTLCHPSSNPSFPLSLRLLRRFQHLPSCTLSRSRCRPRSLVRTSRLLLLPRRWKST